MFPVHKIKHKILYFISFKHQGYRQNHVRLSLVDKDLSEALEEYLVNRYICILIIGLVCICSSIVPFELPWNLSALCD